MTFNVFHAAGKPQVCQQPRARHDTSRVAIFPDLSSSVDEAPLAIRTREDCLLFVVTTNDLHCDTTNTRLVASHDRQTIHKFVEEWGGAKGHHRVYKTMKFAVGLLRSSNLHAATSCQHEVHTRLCIFAGLCCSCVWSSSPNRFLIRRPEPLLTLDTCWT